MSVTLKSRLNLFFNGYMLVFVTALLMASLVSHAESSATASNMPAPEAQGTPVQEIIAEETSKTSPSPDTPPEKIHSQGKVARSIFTSEIIDREPANDLITMDNTLDRIYFFTDLRNLAGQIITHRWEYKNAVMAEVKFRVGKGPRWRVYSSKNLLPEWTGSWTVIVTDENEQILSTSEFNYRQAAEAATSPGITIK